MKIVLSVFFSLLAMTSFSQVFPSKARPVNKVNSDKFIVTDSSGSVYPTEIWRKLLATGRYSLIKADISNPSGYRLVRLSDEAFEKRKENIARPKESSAFKNGDKFKAIRDKDILGEKINTKAMEGKILVINFWFIACAPCIQEMPELNKLVQEYEKDDSIVFISIALDQAWQLKDFIKKQPFLYKIIADGRATAAAYSVGSYPTNVVVSQEGKVYFHTSGYSGFSTMHWLKKSIQELRNKSLPAGNSEAAIVQ